MGLLRILGLDTDHHGQHAAGKHTKAGKAAKQPRTPKSTKSTKGGKK